MALRLRARLAGGALGAVVALALPASAAAQSPPFAPWDGTNPFNCVLQDVGTGIDYPDPDADPLCVKFDKTNQNVTDFGIVEFAAQEPGRIAAAAPKCFYFQNDEWTGSISQGQSPEAWHWTGRYFFDKAKGIGGVSVVDFRLGGAPMDATPYVPPEYAGYWAPGGGGGVIVTEESSPDPSCAAKVDTDEERAAVYSNLPDYGNCVPPGGKIRARKVGRARIGAPRERVVAKVGPPEKAGRERDRWCVVGGGRMTAFYDRGEATFIRTTTPGHTFRGVGVGARRSELRDAGFFPFGGDVYVFPRKHSRAVIASVRERRVRWLGLAFS